MINSKLKLTHILLPAILLALSFNIASAQSEQISENENTFNFKIVRQIKDFLNFKDNKQESEHVNIESTTTIMSSQVSTSTATSAIDMIIASSTLNVTSSTSSKLTCDNLTKLNQRKDKIAKKMLAQIQDKNKLVENLLQISSSSDEDLRPIIDGKILQLESIVSDIIQDQKLLLTELSSSTDSICDQKIRKELQNTKETRQNTQRIKKLESEITKKSTEINNFIKVEIKNILESVIK